MQLWIPAAVAFLIAGFLELLFLALSVVGTLMGGAMTGMGIAGQMRDDEALVGVLIFLIYGLWLLCTVVAGPLHLVAGVAILSGSRNRKLLIAATIASVFPLLTVYCAPSSAIAGALGLAALLAKPPDAVPT